MEFMETLEKTTLKEELFNSVFIGEEATLSADKVEKTREDNIKAFSNMAALALSMQATARKEASKVYITF